jgi:2-hydroxychromene-2-carboxylate isomerase
VTFLPFSLGQVHVAEGQPDVWNAPETDSGLLALQVAVVVRDRCPDQFLAVHHALFDVRHEHGRSLRDPDELRRVLDDHGVDASAVFAEVARGWPLKVVKDAHTQYAASHEVWGVPTFVVGEQAAFVRLMDRPDGDADLARSTIERVVDLLAWPELNEFKHTSIPR